MIAAEGFTVVSTPDSITWNVPMDKIVSSVGNHNVRISNRGESSTGSSNDESLQDIETVQDPLWIRPMNVQPYPSNFETRILGSDSGDFNPFEEVVDEDNAEDSGCIPSVVDEDNSEQTEAGSSPVENLTPSEDSSNRTDAGCE